MGANMAFRRTSLLAVGGFDAYYQWVFDDADIAMRLALAGYGVRSLTESPSTMCRLPAAIASCARLPGVGGLSHKLRPILQCKMGAPAGQPARQVILRVLHLTHGAWLVNGELRRAGHISRRDMWARRLRAMTAGAHGTWDGLGRRRLLPAGSQTGPAVRKQARSNPFCAPKASTHQA